MARARAKAGGMKIHLRISPVSHRFHGWRRVARKIRSLRDASLVIQFGC